jgi:hypothetical protein
MGDAEEVPWLCRIIHCTATKRRTQMLDSCTALEVRTRRVRRVSMRRLAMECELHCAEVVVMGKVELI